MGLSIRDVEELKKRARKMAAGRVLAGGAADLCLPLGQVGEAQASVAAGYGALSPAAEAVPVDRLLYILDGHAEIQDASGASHPLSQGESTVLAADTPYRLVFPTLTIYLRIEARGKADAGSRA